VTVAVIDSGVNSSVPDLAGSVATGPDYTGVNTPPTDPNWGVHGTWMAALVAGHGHGGGHGPFGSGILGSAPASKVLSIRVITDAQDPNDRAYQAQSSARGQGELAEAITYAVSHKVGVISMSLGYNLQSRVVRAALQDAYDHNVVVVASAGNSGNTQAGTGISPAPFSFPADYPGVLSVAAVNQSGNVAGFSSDNLSVQVAAPGKLVPTEGRDGQYWYVSGTSPACALTAGVAALIKSAYPGLTDAQVISAITSSTTLSTRPPGGWNDQIGFGVVNARRALNVARRIAKAGHRASGVTVSTHFGGGSAAVPPVPVAPRGAGTLVGYGLLGLGCLALIAMATSRLLTPAAARSASSRSRSAAPGPGMSGGMPVRGAPSGGAPSSGPPPGGPGRGWPSPRPAGPGDGWPDADRWPAPRSAGPGGGWPAPPGPGDGWTPAPPPDASPWPASPPGSGRSPRRTGQPHPPEHHDPQHHAPPHPPQHQAAPHMPQHQAPRGHGAAPDEHDQPRD
jgi:subtilisin family serine protease